MEDHLFFIRRFQLYRRSGTDVCSVFQNALHLASIGRPDFFGTFIMLARSVTKCNKVRDRKLARQQSYIHQTKLYRQYGSVGYKNAGLQAWICSGRIFCWRLARFQVNCRLSVIRTWITNIRFDVVDVQEASCGVSQQCRIRNNFFGRKLGFPALQLWDCV